MLITLCMLYLDSLAGMMPAMQAQTYGKEILVSHSKKTGVNIAKNQLSRLESMICKLYAQNIIDKAIYAKLNNVRNLRNELQHEDRAIKYSSNQAEEAENVIDQARECLKLLKSKYDNV